MKRLLALVLVVGTLALCGCAAAPTQTTPQTQLQTNPTNAPTVPPTEPPTAPPTELPTDPTEPPPPPVLYTNPLTGEPVDAPVYNRPYCVVFNNSELAMPQHGNSQADILYETLIEGETRCMGVFYDMEAASGALGAIRSARRDFIRLAMGYDAIYVHGGMSPSPNEYSAEDYFKETGWDHIDGVHGPGAENGYYYRTRGEEGYRFEHTLFIKPDRAMAYAEKMGCRMTRETPLDLGWNFSDDNLIVGERAHKVTAWFNLSKTYSSKWHKYTTMNYNPDTGLYEAFQYGAPYIDGNTQKVLTFRNVLILRTRMKTLDNTLMKIDVVGSGEGYFACNGQIIPIRWSRNSEYEPFVYTLENGEPLTLGVGKSYVAIIPTTGHVDYE